MKTEMCLNRFNHTPENNLGATDEFFRRYGDSIIEFEGAGIYSLRDNGRFEFGDSKTLCRVEIDLCSIWDAERVDVIKMAPVWFNMNETKV